MPKLSLKPIETENIENQIITERGTTTLMVTQEDKKDGELIKNVTREKKSYITLLQESRLEKNKNWSCKWIMKLSKWKISVNKMN